ncbi:Ran-binding zinc finger protein [Striga asiatica]|uniref:Ran-binding zinc finger protein n=1 Tax=Striga asiatica TaxID=4170 RepID=A0A5A7P1E6_STRAF|nr:Ran-binding zinc finger protein [Striga asiatica]
MNRPGDWNCRSCQHLNFQRRDSCQRCGDPRPAAASNAGPSRTTPAPEEEGLTATSRVPVALDSVAAAAPGGSPATGCALDRDATSTTSRAGWSASGAMRQGNSVANLHFKPTFSVLR